jgi:hypothetical protein
MADIVPASAISAVSIATSEPADPIAIPTFARAKARPAQLCPALLQFPQSRATGAMHLFGRGESGVLSFSSTPISFATHKAAYVLHTGGLCKGREDCLFDGKPFLR